MIIAIDSIVSAGCIISGGRVSRGVPSPGVRVGHVLKEDRAKGYTITESGMWCIAGGRRPIRFPL